MKNYKYILEAINRGIKFALDDFEDEELQGQTNSKVKYHGGMNEYINLMKIVVDLDLPSGTLWCKYNLGVEPNQLSTPEDWYGKYYAWGELKRNKPKYDLDNYKYCKYNKLTKYCNDLAHGLKQFTDNLTQLLPEDDAACQNKKLYNYKFYIPTKEQCEELLKYTNNYRVNNYDPNKTIHTPEDDGGIQGLNGRIFEGKTGNQLFIPAAGYHNGSDIYSAGSYGGLWSSTLDLDYPNYAYDLHFNSNYIVVDSHGRRLGFSIRPVINL